jgi:hypothetical protein
VNNGAGTSTVSPSFCGACGTRIEAGDDFCRRCGHALASRDNSEASPAPLLPKPPRNESTASTASGSFSETALKEGFFSRRWVGRLGWALAAFVALVAVVAVMARNDVAGKLTDTERTLEASQGQVGELTNEVGSLKSSEKALEKDNLSLLEQLQDAKDHGRKCEDAVDAAWAGFKGIRKLAHGSITLEQLKSLGRGAATARQACKGSTTASLL